MRLFLAVKLPRQFQQDLSTRLDTIREQVRIGWTREENWHLTLMFLGEWPADRLDSLSEALNDVVAGHDAFSLQPGVVGAFPGLKKPRVLFLHLDGGDPLRALAADVREAVNRAWPEGPQDNKAFRPHLTLARVKRPLLGPESILLKTLDLGSWEKVPVSSVHLVESELLPRGPRYTDRAILPLGGC